MNYTPEERLEIVMMYRTDNSMRSVRDLFAKKYPERPIPSISTIHRIVQRFSTEGCLLTRPKPKTKTRYVTNEEMELGILCYVEENPVSSLSTISKQFDISRSSVLNILKRYNYKAYKFGDEQSKSHVGAEDKKIHPKEDHNVADTTQTENTNLHNIELLKSIKQEIDLEQLNEEGLLKMLGQAIMARTEDGGVYLSAQVVETIETFLQKQDKSTFEDVDVKLEVTVDDTNITGLGEFEEVYIEEDPISQIPEDEERHSCKRQYSSALTSFGNSSTLEIYDKHNAKRPKVSEFHQVNMRLETPTCNVERNQTKEIKSVLKEREEDSRGTDINLSQVLNEIIRTKTVNENEYYIPSETVKCIQAYLEYSNELFVQVKIEQDI